MTRRYPIAMSPIAMNDNQTTYEQQNDQQGENCAQNAPTMVQNAGGSGGSSALVLGDGSLRPGKGNAALVRRAIRDGWPIPAEVRQSVVNQMAAVVASSPDERNRISASKVLVAASAVNVNLERLDQADDHTLLPKLQMHVHQHDTAASSENRKRLIQVCERLGVEPPAFLTDTQSPRSVAEQDGSMSIRERVRRIAEQFGETLEETESSS